MGIDFGSKAEHKRRAGQAGGVVEQHPNGDVLVAVVFHFEVGHILDDRVSRVVVGSVLG